jgi:hypothetical protein
MQAFSWLWFALVFSNTTLGADLGKTYKFKVTDLPNTVTCRTTDVVIITEGIKTSDLKWILASSSNLKVKVRTVDLNGDVVLIITGEKAATSVVSWGYVTKDGKDGGYVNLKVQVE